MSRCGHNFRGYAVHVSGALSEFQLVCEEVRRQMERAEAVTMGAAYSVARRPVGDIAATPRRTVTDTLLINLELLRKQSKPANRGGLRVSAWWTIQDSNL